TVGDNLADLKAVLQESASRAEVVLVCGGLGPTADDLTAQAAAEAFEQPLTLFPEWLATITARYASRGRPMAQSNAKQAWLPQGCEILDNPVGTACGFVVRSGQSQLFFTPGVPFEFKQMVREQILPRLKQLAGAQTDTELRRFYTFGVSESALSDMLDAAPWPTGIELGYRSSMPLIELKLIGHGASAADMESAESRLLNTIRPWLVGSGDTEPAQQILALLQGRPLALLEGESGGALLALCHGYPRLEARFSAQLADELAQLPTADADLQLTIGREGSEGVPLLLSADGKQIGQTVKVSHPDPESRRKILAFAALDMLRRHLLGEPILGDYLTLARTAQRG
ncbi:MAG: molybdopterin-binding protein, partial [Aeromonas sobria]